MRLTVRTLTMLGVCLIAVWSGDASFAKKPPKQVSLEEKPFEVDVRPNGTTKMSYVSKQEGKVDVSLWSGNHRVLMKSQSQVHPDGRTSWSRESKTKFGNLARLTGSDIPKSELHYVGQQDGHSTIDDARNAARAAARAAGRPVFLHLPNEEVISIAP
jgi:hypothetical protein